MVGVPDATVDRIVTQSLFLALVSGMVIVVLVTAPMAVAGDQGVDRVAGISEPSSFERGANETTEIQLHLSVDGSSVEVGDRVNFTVTTAEGTPVENAKVSVGETVLLTGADGTAFFTAQEPGTHIVTADKPDTNSTTYLNDTLELSVADATSTVSLSASSESASVRPGETVEITYELTNDGAVSVNGPALHVGDLPDGWSVESHSSDGGIWSASKQSWLWLSIGADATKTATISVSVPEDATGDVYSIGGELVVDGHVVSADTASIPVSATDESTLRLNASRGLSTADNGSVRVTFYLENVGESQINGPAVRVVSIPAGWDVVGHSEDGGTYKASSRTWMWLSIAPGVTSPSITLSAPDGVDAGEYQVTAKSLRNGAVTDVVTQTVTLGAQSPKQVLAGDDGTFQLEDVQEAVTLWANDEAVPGTGGQKLTLADIQEIVTIWKNGETV